MGFLSNLARKVVHEPDDDKAAEIVRRNTMPPPPVSPIVPDGTPPPPVARFPVPPSFRVDEKEPPPGTPEYSVQQMEDVARNTQQAMNQADLSNATTGPKGELLGARFPMRAASVPPPTKPVAAVDGVPDAPVTGPYMPPPPPRTFVGESYTGMTPTERAATRLHVLQNAAPESKVVDTGSAYEVEPPKKMGHVAGAGHGLLTLLTAGANYGIGGMIGAGLFGAGLGAIAPGRIQKLERAREIAGAQQDYASNLGLDEAALQNQTRRITNAASLARLDDADQDRALKANEDLRIEWKEGLDNINEMQKRQAQLDPKSEDYARAEAAIQQEADRLSKRTGRTVRVIPGNPKTNQRPMLQVDQTLVQQQPDGTMKVVYGSPKTDTEDENADLKAQYDWQVKNTENEAKRTSALAEADSLRATAEDHQRKVTAIAGQISQLDAQMAKLSPRQPELGPLKRQRQQLKEAQEAEQKAMDDAYRHENEKRAEAQKYPSMPPPPKRVRRGSTAPPAPPGVTEGSVRDEARRRGQDEEAAVQRARQYHWIP